MVKRKIKEIEVSDKERENGEKKTDTRYLIPDIK